MASDTRKIAVLKEAETLVDQSNLIEEKDKKITHKVISEIINESLKKSTANNNSEFVLQVNDLIGGIIIGISLGVFSSVIASAFYILIEKLSFDLSSSKIVLIAGIISVFAGYISFAIRKKG